MLDFLDTPIEFIKKHLTGWVVIVIILFVIYFIHLRKYYTQREQFYDIPEDNQDTTETTEQKNNNRKSRQSNKSSKSGKSNKARNNTIHESFQNLEPTVTGNPDSNPASNSSGNGSSEISQSIASTTIFDNLNLSQAQIQAARIKYNNTIAGYIIDLGKLAQRTKNNPYSNISKQFDTIIAKGIDEIINYLAKTIQSPNTLTRTSIRNDILNTLTNTLEILIDQTNKTLILEMNRLSGMNSTTIDYNTELEKINTLRGKLETYMEADKMISTYGHNTSIQTKNINDILDKTMVLPIYERNFDKIQQLVNSDYNQNETLMAEKYSQAYTDFLNEEKKKSLDINPLVLASNIESSIVNLFTRGKGDSKGDNTQSPRDQDSIEQFKRSLVREYGYTGPDIGSVSSNPKPKQEPVKLGELNQNANIFIDSGNRGSYMIDNAKSIEGFQNETDRGAPVTNAPNTNPAITKAVMNNSNKSSAGGNNTNILNKLMSGDFLQYIMDTTNSTMGNLYTGYDSKFKEMLGDFSVEDNLIPAGFLFLVISMLLYFIDITSPSS